MASKSHLSFRCASCGVHAPKWSGRCNGCGEWNTLAEVAPAAAAGRPARRQTSGPLPIGDIDDSASRPNPTGVSELDRVMAGGFVAGSVTLLSGEPGIGKSTLLLQAAAGLASKGHTVLYVSAEEATTQVRRRADRVGALRPKLLLSPEADLDAVAEAIDSLHPDIVVVDSIQTVFDASVPSATGSVNQVRASAQRLADLARRHGLAVVLVGHVTKDGNLAGPRVLEHLVDTVLSFEGDRHNGLRFLRATKHRYGPTDELGVFEMAGSGLEGVTDPGGLFLADRQSGVAGSLVVPLLDGIRPLLVEVQALVVRNPGDAGRAMTRSVQGIDRGRLDLVLAVLQQRAGISLATSDVFASVAGGLRANEPGADLGVALAVASAALGRPVPVDLVACGEIGLAGELRQVRSMERRLAEAVRLGFTRAVVPERSPATVDDCGIDVARVADVGSAVAAALESKSGPMRSVQ